MIYGDTHKYIILCYSIPISSNNHIEKQHAIPKHCTIYWPLSALWALLLMCHDYDNEDDDIRAFDLV